MKNVFNLPSRPYPWRFRKTVGGKTICRDFKTRHEAESFARKFGSALAANGDESLFFPKTDRELLAKIREICGDADPLEAVKFWRDHRPENAKTAPPVREAADQFLEWMVRMNRRERTIASMRLVLRRFVSRFSETPLPQIGKDALLSWVSDTLPHAAPKTVKNHIVCALNFLNWCRVAKSWLVSVPAIDSRLLPRGDARPVGIFTADQTRRALRWIEHNYPQCLPCYALRFFAGLRTSESVQMRWEWIDFENKRITVPASVCKTRDAWVIVPSICPDTVFHWLAPFAQTKGAIPAPTQKTAKKISAECGFPPNVARHTFATMHVALYGDEAKTILATRHTDLATLRAHYRGVNQTRKDAEKYFALRPTANRP